VRDDVLELNICLRQAEFDQFAYHGPNLSGLLERRVASEERCTSDLYGQVDPVRRDILGVCFLQNDDIGLKLIIHGSFILNRSTKHNNN